jgi:hypothetical protein
MSQRESSSLRRLRRASPHLGQRSRSPSPSGSPQPPGLLHDCINILASVVSEDCRFRTSNARLTRPPYSLQAVCLDIAQILVKTHSHDAKILSMVGFAVIPAFASFDSALHTRLLVFFENGILRGMLEDLQSLQGLKVLHVKGRFYRSLIFFGSQEYVQILFQILYPRARLPLLPFRSMQLPMIPKPLIPKVGYNGLLQLQLRQAFSPPSHHHSHSLSTTSRVLYLPCLQLSSKP